MAPIKIEIYGETFIAKNNEKGGIRVCDTNLGIAYTGTEDGGRVVFAQKINSLDSKYKYKKPVIVHEGEESIIKEIECRSINGQKKIVTTIITAI